MKKYLNPKKLIIFTLFLLLGLFLFGSQVQAITLDVGINYATGTGLGTQDIRVSIANIIRMALGLLGIVAVVIVLYGGVLYMTSAGNAEKVEKAKKLFVAAIIGLVIIMMSFAIASWILNALLQATGVNQPGQEPNPVCSGPGCDPFLLCQDPIPSDPQPYICMLSPSEAGKGAVMTIKGGKFDDTYNPSVSKVVFRKNGTDYQAEIMECPGLASGVAWTDTQISVEVPPSLPFDVAGDNDFEVIVTNQLGNTNEAKQVLIGGLPPANQFTLIDVVPGPGIACIVPDSGNENTAVEVYGIRFGTSDGIVSFFDNVSATVINLWQDRQISTIVPIGALRGDVYVFDSAGAKSDNGYEFKVTCDSGLDCSTTNCCYTHSQGMFCAKSVWCPLPGDGEPCAEVGGLTCTSAGCQPTLYCDGSCICRLGGLGAPCDQDRDPATGCQADDTKCGAQFYCSSTATPDCTCQYLPQIDAVLPPDGATGNFITILGRGFGEDQGHVYFVSGSEETEAVYPALVCAGFDMWKDNQVIVQIPDAPEESGYTIKLVNTDNREATWSSFTINDVTRPALCGTLTIAPTTSANLNLAQGEFGENVRMDGKNFGETKYSVQIGQIEFNDFPNWIWDANSVVNPVIPNVQPGILPVQVQVFDASNNPIYSNPVNFEVLPSGQVPRIEDIDPDFGPVGTYITINGFNFGNVAGTVRFKNGETQLGNWQSADITFPEACRDQYWKDRQIIVKLPSYSYLTQAISAGDDIQVVVQTNNNLFSNTADFRPCNQSGTCPLRPGICAIIPAQAPAAYGGISLYGDNFGIYDEDESAVTFWDNAYVQDLLGSWTSSQIGTGVWGTSPMTLPADAKTGPVQVIDKDNVVSNKVQFEVADCRDLADDFCPLGKVCCPQDGVCQSSSSCFGQRADLCTYSWPFDTGEDLEELPPQVVEDVLCNDNLQSPTPWKGSTDNCPNIWISARFTHQMDLSTLSNDNIEVYGCGTDVVFDKNLCTQRISPAQPIDTFIWNPNGDPTRDLTGFYFYAKTSNPDNFLDRNRWYYIKLNSDEILGGIRSLEGSGLLLDGNFDQQEGGNYDWWFKVKDTDLACDVDKVLVTPHQAKIELITETKQYNAMAIAENCNILNGFAYDWDWYKLYSDGTIENGNEPPIYGENYGIANISELDIIPPNPVPPPPGDGNVDFKQTATPLKQGLTNVGAQVFPPETDPRNRKDDNNSLEIDLNIPVITRIYPDNGLIHPDVNSYVTIYGKNFGEMQRNGKVYFEDVEAVLADCGTPWTDEIIQVKVPKAEPVKTDGVATYKLSEQSVFSGAIVYYDMIGDSNVILSDNVGDFDGEIKGPIRVNDQFGQALSFNGSSDYVKLPNNINAESGSIEMWFKWQPQENLANRTRQTLLSFSNGTTNIFSLDLAKSLTDTTNLIVVMDTDINATTNLPIVKNQWNQLVYTYNKAQGQMAIYLNGVKFHFLNGATAKNLNVTTLSSTGFLGDVSAKSDVFIGAKKATTIKEYYSGLLDGLAIYNRVLTEDEIETNYGLKSGQILLLHFDEEGSQIIDSSSNQFTNLISVANPAINFRIKDGRYGGALSLSADNNLVVTNSPSVLKFNKEITIEGWFNAADTVAAKRLYQQAQNISVYITTGSKLYFSVFLLDETTDTASSFFVTSSNAINANQWNYFAAVYDGSKIKVFLNGVKSEYPASGTYYQKNYNDATCIGGCTDSKFEGALDDIAIYSRALSDAEINSRLGAKDNSHLNVKTMFGNAQSQEVFKHSENVYPFLCQLAPNFGLKDTVVDFIGDNFGDSNKTVFEGNVYGVGSYDYFDQLLFTDDMLRGWNNRLSTVVNPLSDIGVESIPAHVTTDPYSEPYNDNGKGFYELGDTFADINHNTLYDDAGLNKKYQSNELPFYFSPVITRISPDKGPNGQWVTITGYNFGTTRGHVYFYNNKDIDPNLPPPPCENTWTNRQIIAVVPQGAIAGEVYLETHLGLFSNKVNFTVNDEPPGPGLCKIANNNTDPLRSSWVGKPLGQWNDPVIVYGDRLDDTQGANQLIFNVKKTASITSWSNKLINAKVPGSSETGDVWAVKKVEVDRQCVGFHIGSWCPGGNMSTGQGYEIIYQEVPSNPVNFEILGTCDLTGSSNIGMPVSEIPGFPLRPYNLVDNQPVPSLTADVGIIASTGTYLYTSAWSLYSWAPNYTYSNPGNNAAGAVPTNGNYLIYKIGTGKGGTQLGQIYKVYTYEQKPGMDAFVYKAAFTYHSDGNFYLGRSIYTGNKYYIQKVKFDDVNNKWYLENVLIPEGLNGSVIGCSLGTNINALISSNGRYIFNLAPYRKDCICGVSCPTTPRSFPEGYRIKIYDPQANWKVVANFDVENKKIETGELDINGEPVVKDMKAGAITDGMVVAGNMIYAMPWAYYGKYVTIDWTKKEWGWNWSPPLQYLINGQYDWVNKVFWLGELSNNGWTGVITNKIHQYYDCPFTGGKCFQDSDCVSACGPGTSQCVDGMCTPYIKSFDPVAGKVGTWVTLHGCYFGCESGGVFFTGKDDAGAFEDYNRRAYEVSVGNPECGSSWRCAADPTTSFDEVQVEVPNVEIQPNGDYPPSGVYDWINDAVDGPIQLITAYGMIYGGFEDDTTDIVEDLSDPNHLIKPNYDVNDQVPPNICLLIPYYGNRNITVKIIGESLGETPNVPNDFVEFLPGDDNEAAGETPKTVREPFKDENGNLQYDAGEQYLDYDENENPSVYDQNLLKSANTFQISNFVTAAQKAICPADGWDDKSICFTVPATAGGWGMPDLTAYNNVHVKKNGLYSGAKDFTVTFGSCGNQVIDEGLGEECDGAVPPPTIDPQILLDRCEYLFPEKPAEEIATCYASCQIECYLQYCIGNDCRNFYGLCGNATIDNYSDPEFTYSEDCDCGSEVCAVGDTDCSPWICSIDELANQTCESLVELPNGNLSCFPPGSGIFTQCKFDTSCQGEPPPDSLAPKPKVLATVPIHGETEFCANGIIDMYFDSLLLPVSLETKNGDIVTNRNIKIAVCDIATFAWQKDKGLVYNSWHFVKDLFGKLLSVGKEASAQTCTEFDYSQYRLKRGSINNKTALRLYTTDLLQSGQFYRVTIKGGTAGVRGLLGGILDNVGTGVADDNDYIFEFKTKGTIEDPSSGICDADWVDVLVYSQDYTSADLADRPAIFRKKDLFMCAGKDDCKYDIDSDQDLVKAGNQHIYEALAKYSGGFSLKANYVWSKNATIDPDQIMQIYNDRDDNEDSILDDAETVDADKVSNDTGLTLTTALPKDQKQGFLVIEAVAEGSTKVVQDLFNVWILLCENPWPGFDEVFPITSFVTAYNTRLYFCRDVAPSGPENDLPKPSVAWLSPNLLNLRRLGNANFDENADFTNWNLVADNGNLSLQPVYTDLPAYRGETFSTGIEGQYWLGTYESYGGRAGESRDVFAGTSPIGIVFSQPFVIEGNELKFLIAGSSGDSWPSSIQSIVDLGALPAVDAVVLATRSDPAEPFAVNQTLIAYGNNSPIMREATFNTSAYMTGRLCVDDTDCQGNGVCLENGQCSAVTGIIYIYDNNPGGYISFDNLRQFKEGTAIQINY